MRLSASQIKAFRSCPRAHAWGQERDRRATGVGQAAYAAGHAVHAALRLVLERRWAARAPAGVLAPEELRDALAAAIAGGETPLGPAEAADAASALEDAAPLSVERLLLPPETPWELDLGDGLLACGVWDLVVQPGPDRAEVQDWKSGAEQPGHCPERDPQVALYLLAARALFPAHEVSCALRYLAGETVRVFARDDVLRWAESECRAVARAIAAGQNHPTPGTACAGCHHRGECDAVGAWLAQTVPDLAVETDALLEQRSRLKALVKAAEARIGDAEAELARRMNARGELDTETWAARLRTRPVRALAPGALPRIAEALGKTLAQVVEEVCNPSVGKLARLAAGNAEATSLVEEFCQKRESSAFIDARRKAVAE